MKKLFALFFLLSQSTLGQHLQLKITETGTQTSMRGLSVVNDNVAWVSGSRGWVGRTIDGGKNWSFSQVKDFEKFDFRSLYAFDANTAIIANAGSPANILRTTDGGAHWTVVYTNTIAEAFFDGIDFWNDSGGLIFGDPIQGKMLMLSTKDGGLTWQELPEKSRPAVAEGEASFAASGTTIRCRPHNTVIIATGGKVSRQFISTNKGLNWSALSTPILQGESSTGIFSIAYWNEKKGMIVGGNYLRDTLAIKHAFYTTDGGKNWSAPVAPTRGYRECVEYITEKELIATGPRGTDISYDGGLNWKTLSDEKSFHAVRKARKGKLIIMTGDKGKVALVK